MLLPGVVRSLICTTASVISLQMVLKAKGLEEMTREVSVWLKKRRSSRQSPDVVQLLEVQKRRIQQVKVGRDEQWCRRETRTLQYL